MADQNQKVRSEDDELFHQLFAEVPGRLNGNEEADRDEFEPILRELETAASFANYALGVVVMVLAILLIVNYWG